MEPGMDEFMKFNTLDIIIVVLTGVDAAVLQVVNVPRLPERLGLRPPRLPRERARERHGVELGGAALERPFAQAQLFAVAPRGHVVELAVVVALYGEMVRLCDIQYSTSTDKCCTMLS